MGKGLGLLLVFFGCTLAGWGKARDLSRRAHELELWREFLCQFRVCLETTRAAPGEIVRMLEKQNSFTDMEGLKTMALAFRESGSFGRAAGKLAETARTPGPAENALLSLGDVIGIKPLEEQLSALRAGELLLEREAREAREKTRRYGGLCQRLGMLLGLLAVVVLA